MPLLMLAGLTGFTGAGAQEVSGPAEQFHLHTDRSVYVAGESIHFRVFNVSDPVIRQLDLSTVWYMELISPAGSPYARCKAALDREGASGYLRIPPEIPSGTYYLKGYTRWMRNMGPSAYNYLAVEIVNPRRRQVQPVDTAASGTIPLSPAGRAREGEMITIVGLADSYQRREEVTFRVALDPSRVQASCFITATPRGTQMDQPRSNVPSSVFHTDTMTQLPDTRGISLSGEVRSTATGEPVPYSVVYISTIGSQKEFYCNYADTGGRFYISFPNFQGERELFISASHPERGLLDLYIDQDFCTHPLHLPSYPPLHDHPDLDVLGVLVLNAGIADQFTSRNTAPKNGPDKHGGFFYGTPPVTVRFDDYIRLPSLREYFTEIVPHVSLRGTAQRTEFRVTGEHPDLAYYLPLVMIDGVAIFDNGAVLSVSPSHVDRVEIVDAPYIRGNVTFGGIINIVTREGNLGFVDLPSSGMLVDYTMYGTGSTDPLLSPPGDPSIPDVRNTLFWQPGIRLEEGSPVEIRFRTGDTRAIYRVTVAGYLKEGTYIATSADFRVR